MARVDFGETFLEDVHEQTDRLVIAEEWSRVERLAEDVVALSVRLAQFPELGRELARESGRTMRRIAVGRLPYLIWYRYDPRTEDVIRFSRLFHAHQQTPRMQLP